MNTMSIISKLHPAKVKKYFVHLNHKEHKFIHISPQCISVITLCYSVSLISYTEESLRYTEIIFEKY